MFLVLVLKKSRARVQRSPIEEDKIKIGLSCTFSKNSRRVPAEGNHKSTLVTVEPQDSKPHLEKDTCHGGHDCGRCCEDSHLGSDYWDPSHVQPVMNCNELDCATAAGLRGDLVTCQIIDVCVFRFKM